MTEDCKNVTQATGPNFRPKTTPLMIKCHLKNYGNSVTRKNPKNFSMCNFYSHCKTKVVKAFKKFSKSVVEKICILFFAKCNYSLSAILFLLLQSLQAFMHIFFKLLRSLNCINATNIYIINILNKK